MPSGLHEALFAHYGSFCRQRLNDLTTLLRKLANAVSGLVFLLKCHRYRVYPRFIARSIKFTRLGWHMERLAGRLPGRMLHAAIRDVRSCTSHVQWDLDATWKALFRTVEDTLLWNRLVDQKDAFYSSTLMASTRRLQIKFVALFAFNLPEDPYCAAYNNFHPIILPTTQHATASMNAESVPADCSVLSSNPDGPQSGSPSNSDQSASDCLLLSDLQSASNRGSDVS